jgi:light-regulated signal transduction histidine kinase (bacteriophytochrome)
MVHPEDRTRTDAAVHRAITEFQHYDIEYRIVKPSGDVRWISAKGQAYSGPDGKTDRMQGIAMDITPRKRAEEQLKHLNDALQRSNRDLQEFAYAISHDLQEPLRMVNNFGQLIEKRHASALNDEGREFFHFMIDGAQRMERMIRDLLNYSRVLNDKGTFEPTELRATLLWAMSNLDVLIQESGASINYGALPTVTGDFVRLSQVFQNVLGNAIKYRSAQPPVIDITTSKENEEWVIAVRDNGIGMDPKYAERAFGVFTRMHGAKYPGTGVGLAICKQIVERHRGRIWMETAPDAGSIVYFTLPQ